MSRSLHGVRLLALNWCCAVAIYFVGNRLMVIESDFGRGTLPFWPLVYVGLVGQILVTALLLSRQSDLIASRTFNALLLGYWGCLILFLGASYLDLTTNLQQLRQ